MTQDQFNSHGFTANTKILYDSKEYKVASVDFAEMLIGIEEEISGSDDGYITWKRCENVDIIS